MDPDPNLYFRVGSGSGLRVRVKCPGLTCVMWPPYQRAASATGPMYFWTNRCLVYYCSFILYELHCMIFYPAWVFGSWKWFSIKKLINNSFFLQIWRSTYNLFFFANYNRLLESNRRYEMIGFFSTSWSNPLPWSPWHFSIKKEIFLRKLLSGVTAGRIRFHGKKWLCQTVVLDDK